MKTSIALLAFLVTCGGTCALGDTFGYGANEFDIEFVAIGNRGNVADTTGDPKPAGRVNYPFRMGKFEVSEQMIEKANALGGLGITKDSRGANKPATSVSWNEAARFINWLNTSLGKAPAYKFATQPGQPGYDPNSIIEPWTNADPGYDPNNVYRNTRAIYFLPSVDEWYKAAYFDPTNGVYYDFPTGSNNPPTSVASGTAARTAVFDQSPATGPADITQAGGLSPYGTMGQGGNVWEWHETDRDLLNGGDPRFLNSIIRGGDYMFNPYSSRASTRYSANPREEVHIYGFRIASVPEPNATFLLAMTIFGVWLPRFRVKSQSA